MNIKRTSDNDEILFNLLQRYEKEFSLITKKMPDEDGLFKFDVDLLKTDNYILCVLEVAIGFCIKGTSANHHDIFEFYIVPEQRGNKLGSKFSHAIFNMYKGDWQVRQIEGAHEAISFWRKTISGFTDNQYSESVVEDEYWGIVTRQVFKSI